MRSNPNTFISLLFVIWRLRQNGLVWKDVENHLFPVPCHEQGHFLLDKVAQSSIQFSLEVKVLLHWIFRTQRKMFSLQQYVVYHHKYSALYYARPQVQSCYLLSQTSVSGLTSSHWAVSQFSPTWGAESICQENVGWGGEERSLWGCVGAGESG